MGAISRTYHCTVCSFGPMGSRDAELPLGPACGSWPSTLQCPSGATLMKYLPLVWAALARSRLRTLLTFLSIVVAFLLFGVLHGVVGGLDALIGSMSDTRLRVLNRIGFTHWMPIAVALRPT
jgi:hypothetical protein